MCQLSRISRLRAGFALAAVLAAALSVGPVVAHASEVVHACDGGTPNDIWVAAGTSSSCFGGTLYMNSGSATGGVAAALTATAPAGLEIVSTPMPTVYPVESPPSGSQYEWATQYSWSSGYIINSANDRCAGSSCPGIPSNLNSQMFSIALVCPEGCNDSAAVNQPAPDLVVAETTQPTLAPTPGSLGTTTGWVRGTWPLSLQGDAPSGLCSISATLNGLGIGQTNSTPNIAQWKQCSSTSLSASVNTAAFPNGADPLAASAGSAAGNTATFTRTVEVDNTTPTVTFSGPSTSLSTAGTQDVTATVNTGPSGAYGANCSLDGGTQTFYPGTTARIPVSGVGAHTVTCTGESEAVDAQGQHAGSVPTTTTLDIQQPTEAGISFADLRDALKCRTVTERVRKLGRRRTIRLHGHKVQIRPIRHVTRRVRKCTAHTVTRRVLVALKRNGRVVRRHGHIVRVRRTRRVVVLPHHVHSTIRFVDHGRGTTVSGVLLLADGTALAGQRITVLGALNDGARQFAPIATATTNADGFWVARIPAGPSRLLQAQYAGSASDATASSTIVRTIVPAKIRILRSTPAVAWGRTATFTGRVYGGHIPRGGIDIRLRYGYGGQTTTYGVKTHVSRRGRFTTAFTFGPGDPRDHLRFHFQFATLPGGGYPYHAADSNSVIVRVGGHPRH